MAKQRLDILVVLILSGQGLQKRGAAVAAIFIMFI
jgi:hypothetical protein